MPKHSRSIQPKPSKKIIAHSSPSENNDESPTVDDFKSPPTLSQISQQLNLLMILCVALFLFTIFLFWKIKNVENTVSSNKTAAAQPQQPQPQKPQATMDQLKKLFTKDYISFGDNKRKLLFVEFSDPSCPYCQAAAGLNPELNNQMGTQFKIDTDGGTYVPPVREMKKLVDEGKASYVQLYRNGHGNGILAAQALYCAYDQGKFWEVDDLLMSNAGYTLLNNQVKNDKANIPLLTDFLSGVIDPTYLANCLETGKFANKLTRDTQVGDSFNVGGTPGFFVNTTNFPGAYSFKEMEQAVNAVL